MNTLDCSMGPGVKSIAVKFYDYYNQKSLIKKFWSADLKLQQQMIADWLLAQLHTFEEAFKSYLEKKINHPGYRYDLCCYEILTRLNDGISNLNNLDILSFNYTNPFEKLKEIDNNSNSSYSVNSYRLIHGNLEMGEIIFGFDSAEINQSDLLISPFTKTSRVLNSTLSNLDTSWSIDKTYEKIIIYGHSLSEADYSYFQSLFDSINLYQCKTKLVFYFNVYDERHEKEIKNQYEGNVIQLISRYGESFDNKEKGKNLLHKLLLENRISIQKIQDKLNNRPW